MMVALRVVLFVLWLLSGIIACVGVLAHSGEGSGISDTVASRLDNGGGTAVVERNLDKITYVAIAVFVVCLVAMMFVWPEIPVRTAVTAS